MPSPDSDEEGGKGTPKSPPKCIEYFAAMERRRINPLCIECNEVSTNHRCTFVLDTGEECGAPICSICKWSLFQKEFQDPTRCSKHSFTYDCPSDTEPPPLANSEREIESQRPDTYHHTTSRNSL